MNSTKDICVTDLRNTLKKIVKSEIKDLPETIKALKPEKRIDVICKLLPYVFPKIESVYYDKDEQRELV